MNRVWILAAAAMLLTTTLVRAQTSQPAPDGKLYFTFLAKTNSNSHLKRGFTFEGLDTLAPVAHKHNVPVTWLVDPTAAKLICNQLTEFHEKYGDEVGYLSITSPDRMEQDVAEIRATLPWANLKIAGLAHLDPGMVARLQKMGFTAVWGNCWEQTGTDNITHRGTPWGMFYMDPQAWKKPNPAPGGLISLEWTSRDLNLSYRTGWPEFFSTDPNDVYQTRLCRGGDIEYWKRLVDQYRANVPYNRFLSLLVQQETEQMTDAEVRLTADAAEIPNSAQMLEELFVYLQQSGVEILPASQLVEKYKAVNPITPPTYALFENLSSTPSIAGQTIIKPFHWPAAPTKLKKEGAELVYPRVEDFRHLPTLFVYYDRDCQLFFDEGADSPLETVDYTAVHSVRNDALPADKAPPRATVRRREADGKIALDIEVTADRAMPYGVALWGDYSQWKVARGAKAGSKSLGNKLLFLRLDLQKGQNRFLVELTPAK